MERIKPIRKLRLRDFIKYPSRYGGLSDGLTKLPVPEVLMIRYIKYKVPQTLEEFSKTITYGQRIHFAQPESSDVGVIFRYVGGYYYPYYSGKKWDEKSALYFGRKLVITSYSIHYTKLYDQRNRS